MPSHEATVQQQFDPQASAYLSSAVHAAGPDLIRAAELARAHLPPDRAQALDVGAGAGHLSFALAPHVAQVLATDPSPSMLDVVREAAHARGLASRIATARADGQDLPFPDASFCLAATRYSAHHWLDLERALAGMRRVTKPGGWLLVVDLLGAATPLVDTHLQAMELLRDPSHVRNRTAVEWQELIEAAGFELRETADYAVRLDFGSWVARMRTPPESVAAIRRLQAGAPEEVAAALSFEADGSFTVRTGLFWAARR